MPGMEPRFRDPVSYGMRLERREVSLLRKLASRRNRSVAQLIRDAIRPLLDEAEEKFGKTIPGGPK